MNFLMESCDMGYSCIDVLLSVCTIVLTCVCGVPTALPLCGLEAQMWTLKYCVFSQAQKFIS